ncbi:MAG: hypothetical protein AB7M05_08720 [Alphaproteobacteria bacterium]
MKHKRRASDQKRGGRKGGLPIFETTPESANTGAEAATTANESATAEAGVVNEAEQATPHWAVAMPLIPLPKVSLVGRL